VKEGFYYRFKDISPATSWVLASLGGLVLVGVVGYGANSYKLLHEEKVLALAELEVVTERNIELIEEKRVQQEIIEGTWFNCQQLR